MIPCRLLYTTGTSSNRSLHEPQKPQQLQGPKIYMIVPPTTENPAAEASLTSQPPAPYRLSL